MAGLLPVNWFNLLFALVPIAFGVAAFRQILLVRRLQRVGIEVVGRVVRQREVNSRSGAYSVPTVGFATELGQLLEAESTASTTGLEFFDGDEVLLVYDPGKPTRFLLTQEMSVNSYYWQLAVAVLLVVGAVAGAWAWAGR